MSDAGDGPIDPTEPIEPIEPTEPTADPTMVQPETGPGEEAASTRPPWLIPLLVVLALVAGGLVFALASSDSDSSCDDDDVAAMDVSQSEADIRQLQTDLTELELYSCAINGVYNKQTVDAVKSLQTDLGVTADGIVGPETLAAIDALLAGGSTTSSSSTTAGESTSSTAGETTSSTSGGSTPPPAETPEVVLTVDGGPMETFSVTKCDNPSETTVTLEGESEFSDPTKLVLEAQDGTGTIELSGGDEAEGTVDSVQVGDTGVITASGDIAPTDGSAESASFRLEGRCA